jgi:putative transposase
MIEANACSGHLHMLLRIPPKISVSSMRYLKDKNTLRAPKQNSALKAEFCFGDYDHLHS